MNNKFYLKKNASTIAIYVFVGLIILLLAYRAFDFKSNKSKKSETAPASQVPAPVANEQPPSAQLNITTDDPAISALIEKVFKHIFLPSGNVVVQTVLKPDELRKVNPVFYQFAKEGDKVLVYSDRAILYDPVIDRVLDVIHISSK